MNFNYFNLLITSIAASIAAYGDDSSRSDLTFIPPVTLANVYLPVRSVTWIKVSFHVARIWQTANTLAADLSFSVPVIACTGGPSCLIFVYSPSYSPVGLAPFFLPFTAGC